MNINNNGKINIIDLFSGVGGLSYGFSICDDFNILLANEYDKDIATAYSLNNPNVDMIVDDIKNISKETISNHLQNNKIDLIIGGPPCQSYSTLGKRQMDERAHLFEEYIRILNFVKPKMFVFENVSGLLSMENGKLIEHIKNEFAKSGYNVKCKLLNAIDYGIPQYRERVLIVGTLLENDFEYPLPSHGNGLKKYLTVEDALSDLPILKSGQSSSEYRYPPLNDYQKTLRKDSTILKDNDCPKNGEHLIKIMESLPDGGNKDDLPEEIRPKSGYGNTYAKMWWKKPAPTITRNFSTPSSSRCIHPRDSRALTTREGARLQSFPDTYQFYGSRSTKNLEIGNAVPPFLSIQIAKEVLRWFKKHE